MSRPDAFSGELESELAARNAELEAANEKLRLEVVLREQAEASQQKAFEELGSVTAAWRTTLDSLSDLVLLLDWQGRVLRANRTVESWGLSSVRGVVGSDFHQLLHRPCQDPRCYLMESWRELASHGLQREIADREHEDRWLDRRVRLTVRRVDAVEKPPEGRPFALWVLRDVTAAHRQQRLLSHRDRYQSLERMMRGLGHEIGNPLAVLKTSAQVLRRNFDHFDRQKQEDYLDRILEATDRIQVLVEHALEAQRWRVGPRVEVPLASLFDHLRSVFGARMEERGIDFQVSEPAPEAVLRGDEAALVMVCTELLKNALEACGKGDRIEIVNSLDSREVRLEVRDTGSGIAPADRDRIFQPFFTTRPGKLGLGLTQATHLMQQMDGRIKIDNVPGRGTCAVMVFPRGSASAAENGGAQSAGEEP